MLCTCIGNTAKTRKDGSNRKKESREKKWKKEIDKWNKTLTSGNGADLTKRTEMSMTKFYETATNIITTGKVSSKKEVILTLTQAQTTLLRKRTHRKGPKTDQSGRIKQILTSEIHSKKITKTAPQEQFVFHTIQLSLHFLLMVNFEGIIWRQTMMKLYMA